MRGPRIARPGGGAEVARRPWLAWLAVPLAMGASLAAPIAASAHALLQTAAPPPGAILQQPPATISITFGEEPDPRLSSITVLDTSSRSYQTGAPRPAPGDPKTLLQDVKALPVGRAYTVSWRTFSAVDGHIAAGAYAFGVGVSPAGLGGGSRAVTSPPPSAATVAARTVLFLGLMAALGAAVVALVVFPRPPRPALRMLGASAGMALLGTLAVLEVQRAEAGVDYGRLLDTSLGRGYELRLGAVALLLVGVAISRATARPAGPAGAGAAARPAGPAGAEAAAGMEPAAAEAATGKEPAAAEATNGKEPAAAEAATGKEPAATEAATGKEPPAAPGEAPVEDRGPWTRRAGLWLAAAGAGAAMLVDAASSHAAAATLVPVNVTLQLLHVAAAGVWIGGLTALLLSLRGVAGAARAQAARRFSTVALIALLLVAATGTVRAVVEVGTWDALFGTLYGWLVLVKVALIAILAGLGAVNRFRNVPAAGRALGGLRRVGSAELLVAVLVVTAAAGLVNVAPPISAGATAGGAPPLVVGGSDFATTVRVRLEVSPGFAGFDHYATRVTDYDTGRPVPADAVTLTFTLPARPALGASTLTLERQADGGYAGDGGNLAVYGAWSVRVLVQRGAASTEVTLSLTPRCAPAKTDVQRFAGTPTVYTVHLCDGGTVQTYLDPGSPGADQLHITFFDADGNELAVDSAAVTMTPPRGARAALTIRRLESGHFVADATVGPGTYRFDVTGSTAAGEKLTARVDIVVGS